MKKLSKSIELGTIIKLGDHILGCGDSRDKDFVAKVIGAQKIKAVVSDPPFGVAVQESSEGFKTLSKNKSIQNDHIQSDAEYSKFTKNWLEAVIPHLEKKNSFYIFNADKMIFALREGMVQAGLKFGQLLIWVKTSAVIGRLDYAPQHELLAYGWYGTHEFMKSKDKSVLVYPKPNKSPYHPTTKPKALIRHLILNSTKIGDTVFDGFLGSGTCLLACEETKRKCIGIEIDLEYCQTVVDRWQKLTGKKAEIYEEKQGE